MHTLLTLIPTLRGDLEEDRAHALTDYPDKRCLLQQQQKQNQQRDRDTATIAAQKFTVFKVHSATQMYGEQEQATRATKKQKQKSKSKHQSKPATKSNWSKREHQKLKSSIVCKSNNKQFWKIIHLKTLTIMNMPFKTCPSTSSSKVTTTSSSTAGWYENLQLYSGSTVIIQYHDDWHGIQCDSWPAMVIDTCWHVTSWSDCRYCAHLKAARMAKVVPSAAAGIGRCFLGRHPMNSIDLYSEWFMVSSVIMHWPCFQFCTSNLAQRVPNSQTKRSCRNPKDHEPCRERPNRSGTPCQLKG